MRVVGGTRRIDVKIAMCPCGPDDRRTARVVVGNSGARKIGWDGGNGFRSANNEVAGVGETGESEIESSESE